MNVCSKKSTLHDRYEGAKPKLIDGVQATLDLASTLRDKLKQDMQQMQQHSQTRCVINHDSEPRSVHATQGVGRDARSRPSWNSTLAQKRGIEETQKSIFIFADDYHCSAI